MRRLSRSSLEPVAKRRAKRYDSSMATGGKTSRKKAHLISPDQVLRELPASQLVVYDAGSHIFREGSRGTDCFLITQGRVRILKRNAKGEHLPLAVVKPGDFLGEMSMLSGEKRSASAVALTRVKTILIDRNGFIALLKEQHPFATRLLLQFSSLLASRCQHLLRVASRQPGGAAAGVKKKKLTPLDVRAVLDHVHTLWAV
jgi:CRP-like cAMP-binding protein